MGSGQVHRGHLTGGLLWVVMVVMQPGSQAARQGARGVLYLKALTTSSKVPGYVPCTFAW